MKLALTAPRRQSFDEMLKENREKKMNKDHARWARKRRIERWWSQNKMVFFWWFMGICAFIIIFSFCVYGPYADRVIEELNRR